MAIRRVLVLIQVGGRADEGGCAALVTLLREALVRRLRRRTALRASGAETSTRLHNQSNPSTENKCAADRARR